MKYAFILFCINVVSLTAGGGYINSFSHKFRCCCFDTSDDSMIYCLGAGIILGMGSANERRRYTVTLALIGWAHTQNDPCQYLWSSLKSIGKINILKSVSKADKMHNHGCVLKPMMMS